MRANSKVPQIIELIKEGHTAKEIMDQVSCTRMNVHSVAKRYGLVIKLPNRSLFSPEEKKKINELKVSGLTNKEIAQKLNCSEDTIAKINHGLGQVYRNQFSADGLSREDHARIMINNYLRDRDIEYARNYKGADDLVDLRCKICGAIFTRSMKSVRHNKVRCPECAARSSREREEKRENERIAKIEQRTKAQEEARRLKELEEQQRLKAKEHPCPECGCITTNKKFCSKSCANKNENRRRYNRRALRIKGSRVDRGINLEKVFQRDNGICYICGKKCDTNDYLIKDGAFIAGDNYPSIDHVTPLSKGGLHSWENVKLAHFRCNTVKGGNNVVV